MLIIQFLMKDSSYILHFYFSLFFIKRSNSISYLTNLCIRLEQFRIICIGYDFCGFTGVLISFKSFFFFFQTITPFELDYFFGLNQLKLEIQKLIQESLSKRFSFVLVDKWIWKANEKCIEVAELLYHSSRGSCRFGE